MSRRRPRLPMDATPRQALLALLASANLASRRPLFEQYDAIVQSRTVRRPEQADAAVLALHPPGSAAAASPGAGSAGAAEAQEPVAALAVSIDCNGRRVAADPYRGTVAAVLECASNLACVGGEPLGTTNNLNFGNPEKRHIAWQLTESVRGLGDACRALQAPIVGGNVSLYNEGATGPIYPTPVIGMVGRLPDARRAGRLGFQSAGEQIALVGSFARRWPPASSRSCAASRCPDGLAEVDIDAVRAAQTAVRDAVRAGTLSSAHDIAEGGLAIALAECCLAGEVGASVLLRDDFWETIRVDAPGPRSSSPVSALVTAALFGEGAGGVRRERSPRCATRAGQGRAGAGDRHGRWRGAAHRDRRGADGGEPSAGDAAAIAVSLSELAAAHSSLERAVRMSTASVFVMREGPRDECGVFGLYAPGHEVSRLSYFALYALQHRGQESAGIAAADRGGHIITRRELGLVSQVFSENDLRTLAGELAIGHVRYSTTGSNAWENSQPVQRSEGTDGSRREVALAHNGNLINARRAARRAARAGRHVQLDLGLGDHRRADRHAPGRAARGRDRRRAAAAARGLLDRGDDEGPRGRLPRPARPAPARARRARARP